MTTPRLDHRHAISAVVFAFVVGTGAYFVPNSIAEDAIEKKRAEAAA